MGAVYLFGCTGETITEKSGHLNLGTPGIMCVGAFGGVLGTYLYMKGLSPTADVNGFVLILTALLMSALFAGLAGGIYAFMTVSMRSNQNVTGLALTTFGVGFMKFFGNQIHTEKNMALYKKASESFRHWFGFSDKLGWFGEVFLSHGFMLYFAIALALVAAYVLRKTRVGIHLRSIGENPAAADAAGINVNLYKYVAILIGSVITGWGGLYYVMDKSSGTTFVNSFIDSFGWLAVALVIFTLWRPDLAILGSFLFGALSSVASSFTVPLRMLKIFDIVPYLFTVIILIITSVANGKETQPPASLGLPYFREER